MSRTHVEVPPGGSGCADCETAEGPELASPASHPEQSLVPGPVGRVPADRASRPYR